MDETEELGFGILFLCPTNPELLMCPNHQAFQKSGGQCAQAIGEMMRGLKHLKDISPLIWALYFSAIIIAGLGLGYSAPTPDGHFDNRFNIGGFLLGAGAVAIQIGMVFVIHVREKMKMTVKNEDESKQ